MSTSVPKIEIQPATLISSTTHQVAGKLSITELWFEVPLDHSQPDGEKLKLFCRSAEKYEKPAAPEAKAESKKLPWFVYIRGGPGFGGPAPQGVMELTSQVLDRGYKFLSFDHRGMGYSTPCTARSITNRGTVQQQADYLKYFRADNAVRDLEAIRKCLTSEYPEERRKWTILGQSYGGFVCLSYLSLYPEGLREAFPVGGMAPISQNKPDEPFRRLLRKVEARNQDYYNKYPEDKERVVTIVKYLSAQKEPVKLPTGGTLSARRFLHMGNYFGFHGGLDQIHYIVLKTAWELENVGYISRPTLSDIDGKTSFDDSVLYAILHQPIYAQGQATDWGFDRIIKEFPSFDVSKMKDQINFTGETVLKGVYDDSEELGQIKDTAEVIEKTSDWPRLYDLEQLANNEVPVYAAIYVDDMYVDFDFAMETARLVKGCKKYITNMLYHDAVRSKTSEVLRNLFTLRDDTID